LVSKGVGKVAEVDKEMDLNKLPGQWEVSLRGSIISRELKKDGI